jgi:DNA-binding SARP family transcriptional activator/energy-coupling factor transporter ATP-binding protein EcfA2
MAGLTLAVLGAPDLRSGGVAVALPAKSQALLIYLVMTGKRARREALADMFWGDTGDEGARANLRLALSKLRQSLPGVLEADADSVGLAPDARLDVDALQLLQTVETLLQQPVAAQEAAMARYRGPFLDEFTLRDCAAFEDWVAAERQRIDRRAVVLLRELVQAARRTTRVDRERHYLGLWARIEPWSEEVQMPLIQLQAQAGLMAAALDSFEVCRRALAEEMGARPSVALALLGEQVRRGEVGLQAATAGGSRRPAEAATQPAALRPEDPVPLYGRDADLRRVTEQVNQGERLVMLLGPAGVGKSRLARTIAQRAAADYPDGQVACSFDFMDSGLSDEASQDHFVGVLGSALGLDLTQTAQPMALLTTHLSTRRAIVCLDGFEACEGAAPAVSQVLAAAPHCLILVTSRTRLAITDGWTHELRGLGTNDNNSDSAAGADPAIDLLMDCAARAGVAQAGERDLTQLTRLVRLLDGSPLAIQFAAQSLRLLTPEQLVEKLEKGGWPDSSLHVAGYRYSTLQDVMDDVWGQLPPAQREAWARCALFKGTFSLEWAWECAGVPDAQITALVNRSILGLEPGRRLRMHELTRQYGLAMLDAMPRAAEHRRTFARAALARVVQLLPALMREDAAVVDIVKPEMNTLASAFDMALSWETPQDIHAPLQALWRAYHRLGWHYAAVRLLEAALAHHAGAGPVWRIPWHYMAGEATRSLYGFQRSASHFKAVVALAGVRLPRGRLQACWAGIAACLQAAVAAPYPLAEQRNAQRALTHAITATLLPRYLNGVPMYQLFAGLGAAWLAARRSGYADARLAVLLKLLIFLPPGTAASLSSWLVRQIRLCLKDVDAVQEAYAIRDLGVTAVAAGKWDEVAAHLHRASRSLGALGYGYHALESRTELHSAQLHQGDFAQAWLDILLTEQQSRHLKQTTILRWTLLLKLHVWLRTGRGTPDDVQACLREIHAIPAYRSPVEEISVRGHEAMVAALQGDAVQVLDHAQHVLALAQRIGRGRFYALYTLQLTIDAILYLALIAHSGAQRMRELAEGLVGRYLALSSSMVICAPRGLLYAGSVAALQNQQTGAINAWREGLALCTGGVLRYDAARLNWMLSLYLTGEAASTHAHAAAGDFDACGVTSPYPFMPTASLARQAAAAEFLT